MAFEEEFGAAIPEEDAEKLMTVGAIEQYLQSHGCSVEYDADGENDGANEVVRRIGDNSVVFVPIDE